VCHVVIGHKADVPQNGSRSIYHQVFFVEKKIPILSPFFPFKKTDVAQSHSLVGTLTIQGEHANFEGYVPIKNLFLLSHDFEKLNL
jgi:hypothetical protein